MRGRRRLPLLVVYAALALSGPAQDVRNVADADRAALAQILTFEGQPSAGSPAGWGGGPAGTIFADDKIVHGGR